MIPKPKEEILQRILTLETEVKKLRESNQDKSFLRNIFIIIPPGDMKSAIYLKEVLDKKFKMQCIRIITHIPTEFKSIGFNKDDIIVSIGGYAVNSYTKIYYQVMEMVYDKNGIIIGFMDNKAIVYGVKNAEHTFQATKTFCDDYLNDFLTKNKAIHES